MKITYAREDSRTYLTEIAAPEITIVLTTPLARYPLNPTDDAIVFPQYDEPIPLTRAQLVELANILANPKVQALLGASVPQDTEIVEATEDEFTDGFDPEEQANA